MKIVKYGAFLLVLGAFLYWLYPKIQDRLHPYDTTGNTTLKPGDKEKVIIDPRNSSYTTVTSKGSKKRYLNPDHPTVITEDDKGGVTVETKTIGFEHIPYIGISYRDRPRLDLGLSLAYIRRIKVLGGLGFNTSFKEYPTLFVGVGYNVKASLLINLTVNTKRELYVGIGVKI